MPFCAPTPVPAMITRSAWPDPAHGQEISSTVAAKISIGAQWILVVVEAPNPKVPEGPTSTANVITAGTKIAETLSAKSWIGAAGLRPAPSDDLRQRSACPPPLPRSGSCPSC